MDRGNRMKARKLAKLINSAGRPPKAGVGRYPSGSIIHLDRKPAETEEQILATATAQPHRKPYSDKRSAMAGHAAGRLFLAGAENGLSKGQFQTLETYTRLNIRHMRLVTGTMPRWPSMMAERIAAGVVNSPDPDDDNIYELRRQWEDAQCAIMDAGDYQAGVRILMAVGVMDRDVTTMAELGALRTALNALQRLWAMVTPTLDKSSEAVDYRN